MSIIVTSQQQALDNIERFQDELGKSDELQRRLAFARAWYAAPRSGGTWNFAPSKFCGYENMTAEEYVNDEPRDGRRTEKQLQKWFSVVPESDRMFEDLYQELNAFLARYAKLPSSAIRLNVPTQYLRDRISRDEDSRARRIADLIIEVARDLPSEEAKRIKESL